MRARGCSTLPTAKLLRLAGQLQAVPCTTLVNSYHQLLASPPDSCLGATTGRLSTFLFYLSLSFFLFLSVKP